MRRHLSKSLKDVHGGLRDWVSQRPAWLQPPLRGAIFVYAFVFWRGGLIVLPVAIIAFIFGSSTDRAFLGPLLLASLVYAPAAGFLGGLLYSLARPVLRPMGAFGRYLQYMLTAWAYFAVLAFFILPLLRPAEKLTAGANWALSGFLGLLFGYFLAAMDEDDEREAQAARSQQAVGTKRDGAARTDLPSHTTTHHRAHG